jgi:SPP1 gp7 family putative phage head morphogenesis protein
MQYSLRVIYALERSLDRIESAYRTKLEKFYSDFEKSALRQATRFRDDKGKTKIGLPDSKQAGLDNLLKGYFRDIEKAATNSVKQDLLKSAKTPEERQRILDLKAPKSNKVNIDWADKLASRQSQSFEKIISDALEDAIKLNPNVSTNELKAIIRQKTAAYKNLRIDNTIMNESNRIQNQVRIEAFYNSKNVRAVIFTAVLDNRTTANCRSKHNTIIEINSPMLRQYMIPQHPRCRSYLVPVLKSDTRVKTTPSSKIKALIKNNPVKRLKDMPI